VPVFSHIPPMFEAFIILPGVKWLVAEKFLIAYKKA
jgi:hypothetical protein